MTVLFTKRRYVNTMNSASQDNLIDFVYDLFNWFSPGSSSDRIRKMLTYMPNSVCITVEQDGVCVAFMVLHTERFKNKKIIYVNGVVVDENFRSHGLLRKMLQQEIDLFSPDYITLQTQNPQVYLLVRSICGEQNTWPRPIFSPSRRDLDIAIHISRGRVKDSSLIIPEIYGDIRQDRSYLFSNNEDVNRFFASSLNRNDAFFVIAHTN